MKKNGIYFFQYYCCYYITSFFYSSSFAVDTIRSKSDEISSVSGLQSQVEQEEYNFTLFLNNEIWKVHSIQ